MSHLIFIILVPPSDLIFVEGHQPRGRGRELPAAEDAEGDSEAGACVNDEGRHRNHQGRRQGHNGQGRKELPDLVVRAPGRRWREVGDAPAQDVGHANDHLRRIRGRGATMDYS